MSITPWRIAACVTLLGLAACRSAPDAACEEVSSQPVAQPAAPDRAAEPERPITSPAALARAEVGAAAPDFALVDLDGRDHRLSDHRGKIVVLEWFNPTCPYCVYAYSKGPLVEQPARLEREGVVWLAVNSQNERHPGALPERNRAFVEKHGLRSPILMDPEGVVGRAYGAKTTPHCFVIDGHGVLVYAGALDNAPNGEVDGDGVMVNHVDAAIADVRAGRKVSTSSTRAYG